MTPHDTRLQEQQFVILLEQHQAILHKVCRLYAADREARKDLFQDMVVQLWRAFPQYDAGRSKWSTWAWRIALNVALTRRRNKRHTELPLPEQPEFTDTDLPPDTDALFWAIGQLNASDKALIMLFLEELSYAEMAEVTGLSVSHIGVKLHRIKSLLKKYLTHG